MKSRKMTTGDYCYMKRTPVLTMLLTIRFLIPGAGPPGAKGIHQKSDLRSGRGCK